MRNFTYLFIYLSIYLFIHIFIYVFILYLFVYVFICVFIYLFIYVFIYWFIYLFSYLYTYMLFPLVFLLYIICPWSISHSVYSGMVRKISTPDDWKFYIQNRTEPNRKHVKILTVSSCRYYVFPHASWYTAVQKHHLDWFLCWSENCTAVSIFAFNTGNTVINWFNVQVLFERFTLFPFNFLSSHESASSPRPLTPLLSALMHAWITGLYLKQLTTRVGLLCIVLQNSKPHYIHYAKLLSLVAEQPWGYLFMFAMGAAICCQGLIAWHGSMCTCGPDPAVHSPCFWRQ